MRIRVVSIMLAFCLLFSGCGVSPGESKTAVSGKAAEGSGAEPVSGSVGGDVTVGDSAEKDPTGGNGKGGSGAGEDDDSGMPKAFIYTSEEHIRPMSEGVVSEGIGYRILDCVMTSEFGDRKRENLEDLVADRVDEKGNLKDNSYYVFLTIEFTNTTDSEKEIYRNHGGLVMLDEHDIVCGRNVDAVYVDEAWTGGTPSEIYHYKLGAGESVTSEIGWQIYAEELEAGGGNLYYAAQFSDCMPESGAGTDEDAVFLKLEWE